MADQRSARHARPARRHPGQRPADGGNERRSPVTPRGRRSGARALRRRPLRARFLQHHPRRHSSRHAGQGNSRAADRSLQLGLRVIGLIYLIIGFYVLFRRWGAPRATHFYLFCLVSFALYALKYTGTFDALDWTVFWTNVVAEALQPALFLHFALSFPEERLKKLAPPLAVAAGLRARRGAAGVVALVHRHARGHQAAARPAQPDRHRLRRAVLRPGRAACSCAATAAPTRRCCASS